MGSLRAQCLGLFGPPPNLAPFYCGLGALAVGIGVTASILFRILRRMRRGARNERRGGRMVGLLFDGLTALSLPLLAAVAVIWVRSYWVSDILRWGTILGSPEDRPDEVSTELWVENGGASLSRSTYPDYAHPPPDVFLPSPGFFRGTWQAAAYPHSYQGADGMWLRMGFDWWVGTGLWYVVAPLWAVAVLCGVCPAFWAVRWAGRRRKRRRDARLGLCPRCGYDLRATPERCPECGKIPEKPPQGSS